MRENGTPILLAVFGTTKSRALYQGLLLHVKDRFHCHPVSLAFTSRIVQDMEAKKRHSANATPLVPQALEAFSQQGYEWVLVQSVHLLAGHEFYRLVEETYASAIRTAIGLPLLWSYEDYSIVADYLVQVAAHHAEPGHEAIIFVGHGTDHAAWSSYIALQQIVRQMGIKNSWVGVIEGKPGPEDIAAQVRRAGFRKAVLFPLMLVSGVHVMEDMEGKDSSWKTVFAAHEIESRVIKNGLLASRRIRRLLIQHIADAIKIIPERRDQCRLWP